MKLSQKLLALGGVTLADYACCPYDDYGMPHELCTDALPEKTPFSLDSDWRNGACKAWESNVDATYDGNDNNCGTNENWGSCGFQRHFPWNEVDTTSFRNRGCVVTNDAGSRTLGTGCNCQGYGDAETGAIVCHTINVIAGSDPLVADSGTPCKPYNNLDHGTVDSAVFETYAGVTGHVGVCCNPTATLGTMSTGANPVDISCVQTCGADDLDKLVTESKPKCYGSDFLGRRNIQGQGLYIKDATVYADDMFDSVGPMEFSFNANADEKTTDPTDSSLENNNSQLYNLGGVPFLGGVCKLFVPVPRQRITSVQIAGVHVSLDGDSVFAAKIGSSDAFNAGDEMGTAYCFSVVNPAEGMVNVENNIHNGNVAGTSVGDVNNVFGQLAFAEDATSLSRQAGLEPNINFFDGSDGDNIGDQLEDAAGFTATGDSKVGANFDVVVHIHSEWCNSQSFWTYADMQLTGDFNNGNLDYPLNLAPGTDQRTAAAYNQVGSLQLAQLQEDEASALSTYNTARGTWDTTDTCGQALAADTSCTNLFNDFLAAHIAFGECTIAGTCTTEATTLADAQALVFTDSSDDATDLLDAGCMLTTGTIAAACTVNVLQIDEVATLLGATATTGYINAKGATTLAENFLSNGDFTHAHMDLMDKRHAMVLEWNNVYEAKDGYLRFPHNKDDYFKKADGTEGDEADYVAATNSEYLRWPNAGAFAAFYSFVSCANPPYIHETAATDQPAVNPFSVIYNSGQALTAPDTDGRSNQYDHYGKQNLRARTLVMSQSDSDYRDENCDNRTFRGNLRQVGNDVTVCGPGQLPDTDTKRCSWNWNYYSSNEMTVAADADSDAWNLPSPQSPFDAEEWFDRNNPHSFDMWSTRKRRSESANSRKYAFNQGYWGVQQGKPNQAGDWNAAEWNADESLHGSAIEIPIQDFNFNLNFKTANGGSPAVPEFDTNPADCEFTADACFCRPRFDDLTGFETNTGLGTDSAITFSADYTVDFSNGLAHASCAGAGGQNANGVNKCSTTEINDITANLELSACDGYLANGTGGFKQKKNVQTLVFDDDRVVTSLNPSNKEWEVSVQCNPARMAAIGETVAQRDLFPDCFFGDELWFTFTYSTPTYDVLTVQQAHNNYVSAWTSELTNKPQEYISTESLSTETLP